MRRIGQELLQERKAALFNSGVSSEMGKDVLSLMVKANMESKEGVSDDDVLSREFFRSGEDFQSLIGSAAEVPTFMGKY